MQLVITKFQLNSPISYRAFLFACTVGVLFVSMILEFVQRGFHSYGNKGQCKVFIFLVIY